MNYDREKLRKELRALSAHGGKVAIGDALEVIEKHLDKELEPKLPDTYDGITIQARCNLINKTVGFNPSAILELFDKVNGIIEFLKYQHLHQK